MWLKAQNEMAGLWPHAAMGPVERMVRRRSVLQVAILLQAPLGLFVLESHVRFRRVRIAVIGFNTVQ